MDSQHYTDRAVLWAKVAIACAALSVVLAVLAIVAMIQGW